MVRLIAKKDIKQVNLIRKQVNNLHVLHEPNNFKAGFCKEMQNYINEFINAETKFCFCYEDNLKNILGYAMVEFIIKPETVYRFEQRYAEICEIGVLEGNQKKGIGKQLINSVAEFCKQKGFDRLELNMWSFNNNALEFYKKMGFETYRRYLRLNI